MNSTNSIPSIGYVVEKSEQTTGKPAHFVGGISLLPGAISPNTGRPLLQLLSLDLTDERLLLAGRGVNRLPLLYSWACGIYQGSFAYQVKERINIIRYASGAGEVEFPYPAYPDSYNHVEVALKEISSLDSAVVQEINQRRSGAFDLELKNPELSRPRNQVGGTLRLMQWPEPMGKCPICADPMKLLAGMANKLPGGQCQTDNDFVQVVFSLCVDCMVVSAANFCD